MATKELQAFLRTKLDAAVAERQQLDVSAQCGQRATLRRRRVERPTRSGARPARVTLARCQPQRNRLAGQVTRAALRRRGPLDASIRL